MRKWLMLVLVLAACGEDKTAEMTARFTTSTTLASQTTTATTTAPATTATTVPTTVAPTTAAAEQPIIVKGQGQTQTAPFQLRGGRYKSTWQTFNDCYYNASLKPGGSLSLTLLNADGATTGETFVNGVKAGEQYVDVITGPAPRCRWKITLQRA